MSIFDEQPDGDPHGECAAEIHRLEARITELESRLEIGTGPYDGIAARDETIRLLEARQQSDAAMIDLLKQQHAIDTEQLKSHSANTVGGPTPVMDAAPACEQLLNDNAQKEAS